MQDLLYRVALTLVPNIGCVHAKTLCEKFETAEAIFKAPLKDLVRIEGIGLIRAKSIKQFNRFAQAEAELRFIEKNAIRPLFITDKEYPQRLLNCYDPPTLLYYKGSTDLNCNRVAAIIGTRHHTDYGRQQAEKLVHDLCAQDILIISGLAYGIDAIAHKAALKNNLPTVAVLAHGLDQVYPAPHTSLAKEMISGKGGLLTEFRSNTLPDKHHFPTRNRIVAGMSDAVIVVETGERGGSMITAELANGYNRDVFAIPGKTTDVKSAGCNRLIHTHKAILLTEARELLDCMHWNQRPVTTTNRVIQPTLFSSLDKNEKLIVSILGERPAAHIDELGSRSGLSSSAIASAILSLELQDVIVPLPGKLYQLSSRQAT